MAEPTIICPKCKNEIKLNESLAAPLIETTRREYEKRLSQKDLDLAGREKAIREQQDALVKAKDTLDAQVAEKLQQERAKIVTEEAKKAKLAVTNDLNQKVKEVADLQEILKQREGKLAEAQKAQADLLKKQRELDDAKRELDLTRREYREHDFYPIKLPSGREVLPARGRSWSVPKESFQRLVAENRIYFGPNGDAMPRRKRFLSEIRGGLVPTTWWAGDLAKNEDGKRELKALFPKEDDVFATPKPEALISRILTIATNPGDLALDSFLGSGTTAAVAHKMGRRWIGIELGAHCHTHCLPRLQKVVDGADAGGITEAVGWKGGGGFRYYRLAPSLLERDKWGNWVISKEFNAPMLVEAVCKLEGFTYAPSDTVYWQHGHSTERDFLYVTTANLNHEQLQALSDEVGAERSLLVVCSAFRGRKEGYANLTVKKIPKAVLSRCEWGHDDYSLQVENLPKAPACAEASAGRPPKPGQQELI